jgi:hypothetical protein
MSFAPQPASETPRFTPAPEPALVREQLNRLLAHALFSHSKRYPVLLAYIVEQTLLGNAGDLKERTIGVEAFGRSPDYDVNLDPVVRTSAAEVRKRLVQYYYDSSHAGEMVIELCAGSYVPIFREPDLWRMDASDSETNSALPGPSRALPDTYPEDSVPPLNNGTSPAVGASSASIGRKTFAWIQRAALLLLVLAAGIAIGRYRSAPPTSNMERFWSPITSSPGLVSYCIGDPDTTADLRRDSAAFQDSLGAGRLNLSDVVTLARSIVPLVPRNGSFRVLSSSETTFTQLREGPIVLIGAFSNAWTLRVTEKLRFGFERKDRVVRLVDRKSSPPAYWGPQLDSAGRNVVRDYAIVARIHDSTTGQPVIIIAGILAPGTEAAGELLYRPAYLDALLQKAPRNWDRMNLEALIETDVIESHPGPPIVLAVETW